MYSRKSGLILGFHGCDQSLVDDILLDHFIILISKNDQLEGLETIANLILSIKDK